MFKRTLFAASGAVALLWGQVAFAAANLSPTGPSKVTVGQTFQVVMVVSGAKDVDTIRLNGSFTPDLLEWEGASPAGVFQNVSPGTFVDQTKGIFSFGAFTLSSKANGTSRLAILTFKAKKAGNAYVQLTTNSRILSAGEDQLGTVGRLNITIGEGVTPPEQPQPIPTVVKPGNVAISLLSTTHPDPNVWVSSRNVNVGWTIAGKSVKAVYLGFDQSPEGPAETLVTTSTGATFVAPTDGTWYVHLNAVFADKTYERADLRILIDSTPPHPIFPVVDQTNVNAGIANYVRYGTIDDASGIGRYEVSVNGTLVTSTVLTAYPLKNQLPGDYAVTVKAFDLAGNSVEGHANYRIVPTTGIPAQGQNFLDLLKLMLYILFAIMVLIFVLIWDRKRKKEKHMRR